MSSPVIDNNARRVVEARGVRLVLAGRRTELEHTLAHVPGDAELTETRLAELDEVARRLEVHLAEHARPDLTRTTRPGVLLVGAGVRGDTVVPADREALDLGHLSDRDLAVYAALAGHVADRLEAERERRAYLSGPPLDHRPVEWVLGGPPVDGGEERVA